MLGHDERHPHPYAAIRKFGFKLGRLEDGDRGGDPPGALAPVTADATAEQPPAVAGAAIEAAPRLD